MEYFNILNLKKEPFSNSPEPEFFYETPKYISCLQKLELAVRLRRGLNVVIGDVGTGKTTLCRKMIQQLSISSTNSQEIEIHLLLDPLFDNVRNFLQAICTLIGIKNLDGQENEWQLKEKIKNYLFTKGVDENKIVVLIIDEGQKIHENCVEVLREFLNYETNNFKLLQIIIFAQPEFKKILKKHKNLSDRINYLYFLTNLNFKQMRDMIKFRISVARNFEKSNDIFTFLGMFAIYLQTRGYPRKIILLCHQVLLMLIVRGKKKAGYFLVRHCIIEMYSPLFRRLRWAAFGIVLAVSAGIFSFHQPNIDIDFNFYKKISIPQILKEEQKKTTPVQNNSLPTVNPVSSSIPQANSAVQHNQVSASAIPVQSTSSEKAITEINMPESLGILPITKGRTLWKTIENIYGEINPEIIEKINKANPDLDINKITVGKKINFPSIPAKVKTVKDGEIIVVLDKGDDLIKMYDFFHYHTYKKKLPEILFFPYWNSKEGISFAIILDKKFANHQIAKEAIDLMPSSVKAKAQVISQWDEKSIFFNRHILKR